MADTEFYDANFVQSPSEVLQRIRDAAFLGEDFGQFSWTTADEHRRVQAQLHVTETSAVLEIASGSGGPGLFMVHSTGCTLIGIDVHQAGVATANAAAEAVGLGERATFKVHDARDPLPFEDDSFDAVVCIDSINHIFDRAPVFAEWCRVLRPGGAAWYTDAAVVAGPLRREEMIGRSPSMGEFVFTPEGRDEGLLHAAGFVDVALEDLTAGIVGVTDRWWAARQEYSAELDAIEGPDQNAAFQTFLATVRDLSAEHRLARYAMLATKPHSSRGS